MRIKKIEVVKIFLNILLASSLNKHEAGNLRNESKESNAIQSRDKYAKQVANIIRKYHNKQKESFIFGLSGKWGSGKTTFLEILQLELESGSKDGKYVVLTVSPWKYGSERETFLRNVLKELDKKANLECKKNKNRIEKVIFDHKNRNFLSNLDTDITSATIRFNRFTVFLLVFIIFWLSYKLLIATHAIPWSFVEKINLDQQTQSFLNALSNLFAAIALPMILYRLNVSKISKQVSTLDQFTFFYNKVLSKFTSNNVVVFVDDLDRVSPDIARNVLDSLRTFVDKPEVTYVVTGDHTVLEKHIGSQISESIDEAERVEEGRRYLKKCLTYTGHYQFQHLKNLALL